ncbi:MAG TPA: hypothetical protein VF317_12910 [Dermatophilaceae bacterium]
MPAQHTVILAAISTTGLEAFVKAVFITLIVIAAASAVWMAVTGKKKKAMDVGLGVGVAAVIFACASTTVISNLGTSLLSMFGLQ